MENDEIITEFLEMAPATSLATVVQWFNYGRPTLPGREHLFKMIAITYIHMYPNVWMHIVNKAGLTKFITYNTNTETTKLAQNKLFFYGVK